MPFRISGLPVEKFAHFFALTDAQLLERKAVRCFADSAPGFPCRIGLRDADIGEELILLNYQHQPEPTPYQASHAIFIARKSRQTWIGIDSIPLQMQSRTLSLRAFSRAHFVVDAALSDAGTLATDIKTLMGMPETSYIHAHFAKFGCFAARIDRA